MNVNARLPLVALVACAGLLGGPPAGAAGGSPPVTAPDTVTVRAGDTVTVDVTANDADPDGEAVSVCRLGRLPRELRGSVVDDGELIVDVNRGTRGAFTFTYYACDTTYLTAGTVTVRVPRKEAGLTVRQIGANGKVRITNTFGERRFRCRWGPLDDPRKVDGRVAVPPESTKVIWVRRPEFQVQCISKRESYGFGFLSRRRERLPDPAR